MRKRFKPSHGRNTGRGMRRSMGRGAGRGRSERKEHGKIYMYGKHALAEALANAPHAVRKVFLSAEAARDNTLRDLLSKQNVPATLMKGHEASRIVGEETAHQGVIAVIAPSALIQTFDDFKKDLRPTERTMLVLLDELTDPHNVGAIIRSAAAFGASGVLMPTHHQSAITGAVVKASAGMVFRVPLVEIGNVNYTVDTLQKMGFRAYALAMNGEKNVAEEPFDAPSVVVVGNEGEGVHQKTLERCDVRLRIPMDPRCESLNASVSAAVVLHEWFAHHGK